MRVYTTKEEWLVKQLINSLRVEKLSNGVQVFSLLNSEINTDKYDPEYVMEVSGKILLLAEQLSSNKTIDDIEQFKDEIFKAYFSD